MAIIIPSKNIYRKKQKLPQNYVERVNYVEKSYNSTINKLADINSAVAVKQEQWESNINNGFVWGEKASKNLYDWAVTNISTYYANIVVKIDRFKNQKLYNIIKLNEGLNSEGEPFISYSVKQLDTEGTITVDTLDANNTNLQYPQGVFTENAPTTTKDNVETPVSFVNWVDNEISFSATLPNLSTNGNTGIITVSDNFYLVELTLLVGNKTQRFYGTANYGSSMNPISISWQSGFWRKKSAYEISLTFKGDVNEYEIVDIPLFVGKENAQNVYSLKDNELMQPQTAANGEKLSMVGTISTLTLNGFLNGKETAEIDCSVSSYYTDGNELAISDSGADGKKMFFEVGDIVIPYETKRTPMARDFNGNAKKFVVTGVTFDFGGAILQKLKLQEK